MAERAEKIEAARQALLDRIIESAPTDTPVHLKDLAEAYAWVSYPDNAHGGTSKP